jgi:hypothetical protein
MASYLFVIVVVISAYYSRLPPNEMLLCGSMYAVSLCAGALENVSIIDLNYPLCPPDLGALITHDLYIF